MNRNHHFLNQNPKKKRRDRDNREEKSSTGDDQLSQMFSVSKERPLAPNNALDQHLFDELMHKQKSDQFYQKMFMTRRSLPAYAARQHIIDTMEKNQVTVISGETGCGKSTQIPQFILDHYITNRKGSQCNIVVTQPRRISAIGLGERVSQERSERIGETVGYSIRLERRVSQKTRLMYCTTGILLRRLMGCLDIASVSHVIIDEVHERSIDIDFLLVILKDLIKRRTDLKLILMSATLNADLFSEYFGKAPVLNIPGRTFPVKSFFLEDLLDESRMKLEKPKWSNLSRSDERMKSERLKAFYGSESYPERIVHSLARWDESAKHQVDIPLVINTILHICKTFPMRHEKDHADAILVFMPGMFEITSAAKELETAIVQKQIRTDEFWVIPLHSHLPTYNQKRVFQQPPAGVRKIVFATNIAETSITINDVKYVVDTGKMREMSFDPTKKISILSEQWITRAHGSQRQGRAGRVGPGLCYKLYSRLKQQRDMLENPVPELLRSSLENVSLQIKLLRTLAKGQKLWKKKKKAKVMPRDDRDGVATVLSRSIEPPSSELIAASVDELQIVGALDDNELLTPLGFHLAKMPVGNVRLGKMCIYGVLFQCVTPMLIIASILTCKSFFVAPLAVRDEADARRRQWYIGKSDHLTAYRAFRDWKAVLIRNGKHAAHQFCYDNFLSFTTLQQIDGIAQQYANALRDIKFLDSDYDYRRSIIENGFQYVNANHRSDTNSGCVNIIKAILVAGLYPNVIRVQMPKAKMEQTITGMTEKEVDSKTIRFYLHPSLSRNPIIAPNNGGGSNRYDSGKTQAFGRQNYETYTRQFGGNSGHNNNDRGGDNSGAKPSSQRSFNSGRIFIHGSSSLKNEREFDCGWLVYLTKMEIRDRLSVYDASAVTSYGLLLFGGEIVIDHDNGQLIMDRWVRFVAPGRIAVFIKELRKRLDALLMKKIEKPTIDVTDSPVLNVIQTLLRTNGE